MGRAWASGSTSSSIRVGFPASVNWLCSPQATVYYETAAFLQAVPSLQRLHLIKQRPRLELLHLGDKWQERTILHRVYTTCQTSVKYKLIKSLCPSTVIQNCIKLKLKHTGLSVTQRYHSSSESIEGELQPARCPGHPLIKPLCRRITIANCSCLWL